MERGDPHEPPRRGDPKATHHHENGTPMCKAQGTAAFPAQRQAHSLAVPGVPGTAQNSRARAPKAQRKGPGGGVVTADGGGATPPNISAVRRVLQPRGRQCRCAPRHAPAQLLAPSALT